MPERPPLPVPPPPFVATHDERAIRLGHVLNNYPLTVVVGLDPARPKAGHYVEFFGDWTGSRLTAARSLLNLAYTKWIKQRRDALRHPAST